MTRASYEPHARLRVIETRFHRFRWGSSRGALPTLALAASLCLVACGDTTERAPSEVPGPGAEFVGADACRECHTAEYQAWRGSHHDLAMQPATEQSVLGDFDDTEFRDAYRSARFFRRGDAFMVHVRGASGAFEDHEVRYTFGVDPLQQYLVEFPDGRVQALTLAWDARPEEEGGQRWFSLHPGEATPPGDVLHWTGAANRWNTMCAHCHSTALRKGFEPSTERYNTEWAELDVACEACHGAGSLHVAAASSGDLSAGAASAIRLGRRARVQWAMNPETGIATRVPPQTSHQETQACAGCHSRRSLLSEGAGDGGYHDRHRLALLEDSLYFPDGQIQDEVYVYGSFLQSKMHAAGVVCSDCHDPHSLRLRDAGRSVCSTCHADARFADASHHHHETGSPGAQCVSCHMPSRTYMGVDERRDHSFRVPRPDLSEALDSPDACTSCHRDRGPAWAVEAMAAWGLGEVFSRPHFGSAFRDGRRGVARSAGRLSETAGDPAQPAIVRATALWLLAQSGGQGLDTAVAKASRDAEPLVRRAAARAAEAFPPERRPRLVGDLLDDPTRVVRIEAGRVLAPTPETALNERQSRERSRAIAEYEAVQALDLDRPEALGNLAWLYQQRGDYEAAEAAYGEAIRRADYFVPSYVNLADLRRRLGREALAERTLRDALDRVPGSSELLHALGLSLVRQGRLRDALAPLEQAAETEPRQPRFTYVYGVALHSAGDHDGAIAALEDAHERWPDDRQLLLALATMTRDAGNLRGALVYAKTLEEVSPGDAAATRLRVEVELALADAVPGRETR